ncbi:hypothetical protein IFT92_21865 [Peribacillus simplex]|uniref:hypothetical protein n=1 Tax=Peribacillus simplex TaxID=1478 RepID=UPI001920D378|nr:hypothetical protein [Peribacillus simplex]MBD8590399.1 hypothetical protein [Peribacillus simplex]
MVEKFELHIIYQFQDGYSVIYTSKNYISYHLIIDQNNKFKGAFFYSLQTKPYYEKSSLNDPEVKKAWNKIRLLVTGTSLTGKVACVMDKTDIKMNEFYHPVRNEEM